MGPLWCHQNSPISGSNSTKALIPCDALPSSFINSNMSLKLKQRKSKELGAHSLTRNTSGVEGRARAPGWDKEDGQAIHLFTQTCTNQTTNWLMHSWNTFGARMNHGQTWTQNVINLLRGNVRMKLTLPNLGLGSPSGLPNLQSSIIRVKTL